MSRRISAVYSIPELPLSFDFHIFIFFIFSFSSDSQFILSFSFFFYSLSFTYLFYYRVWLHARFLRVVPGACKKRPRGSAASSNIIVFFMEC